ncbi:class I SAM-dependent methyltransferase [Aeromonas sp. MR16]|uniref:class I SAM-dependent methyltransferase n=1 Tax=Aeromonas sp. MR16 TaxID=2923420 RepID=UPI001F4AC317|nr:class I SAM-dependent methyltransferase [Aeromonas sp. MR16]MCH7373592.1 class I SAM-dependent methyltransferase [Aeromonas sp. MR16]
MITEYDTKNILFWDELADIHSGVSDYDLSHFHPHKHNLREIELNLLGDIAGKKVLHLQCHVGFDSFALEMLGAEVTAIDYSASAIEIANRIKDSFNLKTNFHCANVCDLSSLDLGEFDIVFTSYGVLVWLRDLKSWAISIATHLKEDGLFCIVDEHPFARVFSNPNKDNVRFNSGYLHTYGMGEQPFKANYKYSYASDEKELDHQEQYVWSHSISELINSLVGAGLNVVDFSEYEKTFYRAFSDLVINNDKWWVFEDGSYSIPLTFSLCAKKRG